MSTSEKIDRIVTNRILGLPIFLLIMYVVYYLAISTFGTAGTDWVNDNLFGEGFDFFGIACPSIPMVVEGWLTSLGASDLVISLANDGIVAGVGAVLGFIPQMFVLFILLSFLEDCGYMARVAFVMDRVFRRFGLSGKSFIPMLVSTGCGVPGVLATKTIENEKDRRMTVMTTTFIPCGAKLPIIALLMGALVGDAEATWIAPLFYFLGVVAVIVSGIMLKKTKLFAGRPTPFVMELPSYHFPSLKSWWLHIWERVSAYVKKAFTIIFASTIVVWFLSNFGVASWDGGTGASGSCPPWRACPRSSPTTPCLPCSAAHRMDLRSARLQHVAGHGYVDHRSCGEGERDRHGGVAPAHRRCRRDRSGALAGLRRHVPKRWRHRRFRCVQPALRAVLRGHGHHPRPDELRQVDRHRAGLRVRLRVGRGPHHQPALYLIVLGEFGLWTVVAFAFIALILFQLFRPMPKGAMGEDDGVAPAAAAA